MPSVTEVILSKRVFYSKKLAHFSNWITSKSGMNGASDKKIRTMLYQILKELGIVSGNHIVTLLYGFDFDASKIVRIIAENIPTVFDLFHKEKNIADESVQACIYTLQKMNVGIVSMTNQQIAGLCVFIQLILSGARNEIDGFGTSEDLVKKWKKSYADRKNRVKQIEIERQKKEQEELLAKENEERLKKKAEEEKFQNTEILDSWEDALED